MSIGIYSEKKHQPTPDEIAANFYPTQCAFTVQINLPETAVPGALALDLPEHMRKSVEDAFPFPEGRWTFIPYQVESDIPKFQRLIQLRVASRLDKKGK